MNSDRRKIFAHAKQIKFLKSRAKQKRMLAGRGSGKSSLLGSCVGIGYREMPRAKVALAGVTYVQLDQVVVPEIISALDMMGIFEYNPKTKLGHYVRCKQPPADWDKPYKVVGAKAYQYCWTFINGYTLQLVSQDRAESYRGSNFDALLVDEAAKMLEDFIYRVLTKAIRGNIFKKISLSHMFHSHYEFSSAAWLQSGFHIYKYEDLWKAQNEERSKWSYEDLKKTPPLYYHSEATCLDNPMAGQEYWDREKVATDPLEFDVEVANMRLTTLPNGFYHAFKTSVHTYWEKQRYEHDDKTGLTLMRSNDYREDLPLDLSLDFNADICWAVCGQEVNFEYRVIRSNFVKPSASSASTDIVIQQGEWFVKQYQDHPTKEVYLYGDPNGNSRTAATNNDTNRPHFDRLSSVLTKAGWTVIRRELKFYPKHKRKYILVNSIMMEDSRRLPKLRINQHTNKVLIITLQSTPIDSNTYTKNKKMEKKAKPTQREYAPDGTDALDYLLWAKYSKFGDDNQNQKHQLYIYGRK